MKWLVVYAAMCLLNVLWTCTVKWVATGRIKRALVSDAMLVACQGVVTVSYVEHGLGVVIPAMLGSTSGLLIAHGIDKCWKER